MTPVNILIPTYNRPTALTATLVSVVAQTHTNFSVIIANQGDGTALRRDPSFQCICQLLQLHENSITIRDNVPPRGMAQQRQFLLDNAIAPYVLFLDDDVLLEPYVLANLVAILQKYQCGFAGNGLIGLSFQDDYRPAEEHVDFWGEKITPETITPGSKQWQRHTLHNAANLLHVQRQLGIPPDNPVAYKVAWIGGCVLFDVAKLRQCGGFTFWEQLPSEHAGEDVLAQLRVMKRFGGCGVLPSGAYHQEIPTTIQNREANAPAWLLP